MSLFPESTKPHAVLVDRAARWLRGTQGCAIVLAEIATACDLIPDAIGWQTIGWGWSILVECKTSRADFRADLSKRIHTDPDNAPGQERWYFTPPGLIRPRELPPGWQLAECHGTVVRKVVDVPWTRGMGPARVPGRVVAEQPYLLAALRRHQTGVAFDADAARFETLAMQGFKG